MSTLVIDTVVALAPLLAVILVWAALYLISRLLPEEHSAFRETVSALVPTLAVTWGTKSSDIPGLYRCSCGISGFSFAWRNYSAAGLVLDFFFVSIRATWGDYERAGLRIG